MSELSQRILLRLERFADNLQGDLPDDQKEHLEVWRCHRANPQAAEQARKWLRRVRSGDVTGSREANA